MGTGRAHRGRGACLAGRRRRKLASAARPYVSCQLRCDEDRLRHDPRYAGLVFVASGDHALQRLPRHGLLKLDRIEPRVADRSPVRLRRRRRLPASRPESSPAGSGRGRLLRTWGCPQHRTGARARRSLVLPRRSTTGNAGAGDRARGSCARRARTRSRREPARPASRRGGWPQAARSSLRGGAGWRGTPRSTARRLSPPSGSDPGRRLAPPRRRAGSSRCRRRPRTVRRAGSPAAGRHGSSGPRDRPDPAAVTPNARSAAAR